MVNWGKMQIISNLTTDMHQINLGLIPIDKWKHFLLLTVAHQAQQTFHYITVFPHIMLTNILFVAI